MSWQYTDSAQRVVARVNADGSCESMLASQLPQEVTPLPQPAADFAVLKTAELAAFRNLREAFLNRTAGIAFAALQAGDTVTVTAAGVVRQGLLDLPSHPSVAGATDIASLHQAIKAQYAAIVGAIPAAAKAAFAKVDS